MALFGVLRENLAKFLSKWRFQTNLNTKMIPFSILKKVQKFCLEILRNFSKRSDLKLHIFEKLLLKNAINHELLGYLKLHKFWGVPPKKTLVVIISHLVHLAMVLTDDTRFGTDDAVLEKFDNLLKNLLMKNVRLS